MLIRVVVGHDAFSLPGRPTRWHTMDIMSETSKIGVPRVTRRDLGKVAIASVAALEASQSLKGQQKYTGALGGFEDKVDASAFDPVRYTSKLHDSAPLRMTFQATTRAEAERWQTALRAKVLELVGGFPAQRSPLQPQTLEVREFPGYRREKFVFQSRPAPTCSATCSRRRMRNRPTPR